MLKVLTLKLSLQKQNKTKQNKNAKPLPLRIVTWNVRTMQTGLDNMDLSHGHIRKTAVIDRELSCLNLDIAALLETRIAGSGSLKEGNYTFFLERPKCRPPQTIRISLVRSISAPIEVSKRIMSLCLQTTKGSVNLVSACSYTWCLSIVKDTFMRLQ